MRRVLEDVLRREADSVLKGYREVNVGDLWRMYGVRKAGSNYKAGVGPLPETKQWGCGTCGMTFGKELYPDVNAFYFGHVVKCGMPIDWGDWE